MLSLETLKFLCVLLISNLVNLLELGGCWPLLLPVAVGTCSSRWWCSISGNQSVLGDYCPLSREDKKNKGRLIRETRFSGLYHLVVVPCWLSCQDYFSFPETKTSPFLHGAALWESIELGWCTSVKAVGIEDLTSWPFQVTNDFWLGLLLWLTFLTPSFSSSLIVELMWTTKFCHADSCHTIILKGNGLASWVGEKKRCCIELKWQGC